MADVTISGLNSIASNQITGSLVVPSSGGRGGSGIVVIRYKGSQAATGGQSVSTYAINGITYTVHKFTTTGNSNFIVN